MVGRSRGFWEHFYPSLQRVFPEQLGSVPIAVFHRAINKVARSTIRTDADEMTYNLHIMLRFNLELQLLEGELRAKDLPEAWRAAMKAELGVAPVDDRDGCLQDVHWHSGYIGGRFHSLALGHLLRRRRAFAAVTADGEIASIQGRIYPGRVGRGRFVTTSLEFQHPHSHRNDAGLAAIYMQVNTCA